MKNIVRLFSVAAGLTALFAGCSEDLLMVEQKTAPTSSYLYTSTEGLQKAIVGLYTKDRSCVTADNAQIYVPDFLDYSTDLMIFRGGTAASLARLDNNKPETSYFQGYWNLYYTLIGKANEVIAAAKKIGLDKEGVAQPYGEACLFRAKSYLLLYKRFERLYLNLEPTSVDNAFGRTFRAASKDELFAAIKTDLDEAEKYLEWKYDEPGRLNKAVAKHVKAIAAMWEEDYDTAAQMCEDIFNGEGKAYYGMEAKSIDVFQGADYDSKEVLYAFQFSNQPGGGNSTSGGNVSGHTLSLIVTPAYQKVSGMIAASEYGGYGWGRVYPNTHLLSLYDKTKDNRYSTLFAEGWICNDPSKPTYGTPLAIDASQYIERGHIYSVKHMDKWTNQDLPSRTSGFRDVLVYRLAQTALLGAEAYYHKGNNAKALEFFNKTYQRAMGEAFTGTLTLDDILDETARECHFEGVRWSQLKRLGLLAEKVHAYYGDLKTEDPKLNADYVQARTNFRDNRDYRWPIPQAQLDLMPGFGQNAGWF